MLWWQVCRLRTHRVAADTAASTKGGFSADALKSRRAHRFRHCSHGLGAYGRGRGVGRGLGGGLDLGVGVGRGVAVGVVLAVAVGVAVGVGVGVAPPAGAWIATVIGEPVLKKPIVALPACGG
jgi:hypothetical protein